MAIAHFNSDSLFIPGVKPGDLSSKEIKNIVEDPTVRLQIALKYGWNYYVNDYVLEKGMPRTFIKRCY
jgi:hypothetical protein